MYDLLDVARTAAPELVEHSYRLIIERLESAAATGSEHARNEMVATREAYRVLGSPERRAAYDREQEYRAAHADAGSARAPRRGIAEPSQGVFLGWWDRSKTSWVLVGLFALGVMAAGRAYYVSKQESLVRQAAITEQADAGKARIQIERDAFEARQSDIDQRQRRQQSDQEQRERRAQLDADHRDALQRAQYQVQIQRIDEQAARDARQADDRTHANEQTRVERERRYWSCMNQSSPTGNMSRARAYCGPQP